MDHAAAENLQPASGFGQHIHLGGRLRERKIGRAKTQLDFTLWSQGDSIAYNQDAPAGQTELTVASLPDTGRNGLPDLFDRDNDASGPPGDVELSPSGKAGGFKGDNHI